MANKNILLIEPGYKNKYPPLGLMKIAAYHGPYGKKDNVKFIKGMEDGSVRETNWDRIYITTLFSFEWKEISKTIDHVLSLANGNTSKVFIGGIAASLMYEKFIAETRWRGVRIIKGLLSEAPAISLQLDEFEGEFYADDRDGTPIEDLVPDYSILDQIKGQYHYPVHDAYFAYASRGCIRKCSFCGVPKLEGAQRDAQSITALVKAIEERHGSKRDLMLMDNNVVASANYKEIIAEIRDLGFVPGAKLTRPGRPPVLRRVDFNQGVDARILCKDEMYLKEMSTICIKPLRIAFDHLGVKKPYETAIRMSHNVGLHDLSNYMLYNFMDTPSDLYERMRLNINLNEELGIRIFSFPMRFQPTDQPNREHVGDHWSKHQLRSMQVILQATHGIVSGAPNYFMGAFGSSSEEFESLLLMPHHYIFNRTWYKELDGKDELLEYKGLFNKLTDEARQELKGLLSSTTPRGIPGLFDRANSQEVKSILRFYVPPKNEQDIWSAMKKRKAKANYEIPDIPEDELVEDAGLTENV